jgi:diadenosine tetraphosphate (Ap4A) HIT family hydrolase
VDAAKWERLVGGAGCALCAPRPKSTEQRDWIATLSVSSLYLAGNQAYRGQCVLVFDPHHAARPDRLSAAEWGSLCADLFAAQSAVMRTVHPDHINLASLGNEVPHLHWHIIPRYLDDPRWGRPIWTTVPADMPEVRLAAAERAQLIENLQLVLRNNR